MRPLELVAKVMAEVRSDVGHLPREQAETLRCKLEWLFLSIDHSRMTEDEIHQLVCGSADGSVSTYLSRQYPTLHVALRRFYNEEGS